MSAPKTPPLTVLMLPDYRRENPYQALLAAALRPLGVAVRFPSGYRRVLPVWRAAHEGSSWPDVVHLHWLAPYLKGGGLVPKAAYGAKLLVDLALLRASGAGLVWTVHNLVAHDARHPRLDRLLRLGVARLAQRLIVHDEVAAGRVTAAYGVPSTKVRVIPHGHYRDAYGPPLPAAAVRARLGLPPAGRVVLALGLLRPYKRIERLLQAWGANPALAASGCLVIAGRALEPAYAETLAARVRDIPGVRFLPRFLEPAEVGAYLSAADVMASPARVSLASGAVMLALSYGKPVVAPRHPALAALLDGAADLLYDEEDAGGLGSALERALALDAEALVALGARTGAACDRLAWPPIAEALAETYRELTVR